MKSGQIEACSHAKNVPVRPQPDRDFIGDQMHAEFVAQRAKSFRYDASCIAMPAAHCTSGSTMTAARCCWRGPRKASASSASARSGRRRSPCARIRRRDHMRVTDQRVVGVLEQGDIGYAKRADRLAVIAVREARRIPAFRRLAAVAPDVKAHLQRDFDGRCAIGCKERVAERALGQRE